MKMKFNILPSLFLCFLFVSQLLFNSCQNNTQPSVSITFDSDSIEIASTIHRFYSWYDAFSKDTNDVFNFVNDEGDHYILDTNLLNNYLNQIYSCGLVSQAFITNEKEFYLQCEKLWSFEDINDVPSCLDGDHFFCAQEWEIDYWTKSPIRIKSIHHDTAHVVMYGLSFQAPLERSFALTKIKGFWKILSINCELGITSVEPEGQEKLIDDSYIINHMNNNYLIPKESYNLFGFKDFMDNSVLVGNTHQLFCSDTLYFNSKGKVFVIINHQKDTTEAYMVQYSSSNKMVYWEVLYYTNSKDSSKKIKSFIRGEEVSINITRRHNDRTDSRVNTLKLSPKFIFERI